MNSPEQGSQGLVGQTIAGRYNVIRVLGEGGMGVVYVGEQKLGATTRKVAIKTLHPHLSHDPKILARFERECGTIAELQHPNTIQVYDFGKTDDGTLYIVMEYVEGKSVAEVLEKEGPMAPTRVEKILSQVVGSLEEAHTHDIVHRDLKPENVVLCDRAGQKDWVEVLDFGIAKRQKEEDSEERKLTQAGMVLGTPPYMSPEQFTGRPIDARSDIYSLGIMAYEMLTGRLPFNGNTAYEWATAHMVQAPAPIETQPMGQRVPQAMRDAVQRALAKDPGQRFSTVREFYNAFTGQPQAPAGFAYAQTAALGAQQAPAAGYEQGRPAGGYGGTAPGVSAGYVTGPTPGYSTGDVPQQRRGTEIGAQVDAPGYGPPPGGAPQYGPPPNQGYGPPPAQPVVPAYHPSSETASGGGARKGLIIGGLVAALAVCGVAVAAGMGAFSGGSKGADSTEPLFPSASTAATTPPPQPSETPSATPTTTTPPSTGAGLPPLRQERPEPPRERPPTTSTRKDASAPTAQPPPQQPQQPLPPPPPYQPPVQPPATQPPPPPQQPGRPGEPAECAAARTWCARAATDPRAVPFCNSKTAACRAQGGTL
ncbi:serine/threonine protein kinase [Pendulispora brunnea]|uniref:Serine/threonine protein kinase n=1 Tax=Pendulispora brunnea TaxID=2905690 RepID=A0ABZ2K7D3_9BACT